MQYTDPQLVGAFNRGRDTAIEFALSNILDSIQSSDLPGDLNSPTDRAYHAGWNTTIHKACLAAAAAIEALKDKRL